MKNRELDVNRSGYWRLVRENSDFRYLWFGQIVSLLGDWFNLIASATLVGYLTDSGLAVGALFIIRMLSPFLTSPVAGVVADRYDRRKVLIAADVARAVVVLGFLLVREAGDIWLLYMLTAIQLGISGFFFPARNAILPNIVGPTELGAANALSSATWSIMLAFGTALGGLVAGGMGVRVAFVVDAASFGFSAVLIAGIRFRPAQDHIDHAGPRAVFRQYAEGLSYLKRHLDVLAIVLNKAALTLTTSGAFQVILVALADRLFVIGKGGGIGLGLMFGTVGVGTGLGPIIARRFTGDRDRALRIAIAAGFFILALGVAIAASLANFETFLCGILLRGAGGGIVWVFSTQLLMHQVPNHFQGRVFATEFALFTLMGAVSAAASGWAIDVPLLGISRTLWVIAGLCLVPFVLWGGYVLRAKKRSDAGNTKSLT
ncbi:MAG: MFS transporter [Deltaproteobacteria bacterium]|nr:MFS transporter [Deltaproteobacteria bacterium]